MSNLNTDSKVLVLGSSGLVGSSLVREFRKKSYKKILTPRRKELDLTNQQKVLDYFKEESPEFVFLAAAKVGGIVANNTYRADFIYENLTIQNNVFGAAHRFPVKGFVFLGSSCIYPRDCPQPIKEEYLLTSSLEPTNEPYAVAKIAGLKTAESFRRQYGYPYVSVMPTNLYGPGDNYHPENSHVIPGLIRRMHEAKLDGQKEFVVWGSGNPKREFLFVDDLARACLFVSENLASCPELINVGMGKDITIKELAALVKEVVSYGGDLVFDTSKPDGTPRKLLDTKKINDLGWSPQVSLRDGLKRSYEDFIEHYDSMKNS